MTNTARSLISGVLFLAFSIASAIAAAAGTSGVTYQGRILKPDGTPLSGSNVQFKLQIRAPDANNCLMYEELQALDMHASNGSFSLTINDGTGARLDSSGYGLDRIFANRGTFNFSASSCASGTTYIPGDGDGRNFVVLFKDETMTAWEPIPAQKINFVPFAFESKQVQGFTADSLLRVVNASGDPITGLAPLSNAQYTALLALASGTSTAYTKSGELNGVALPAMSSGEVLGWNGSAWVSTTSTPGASSITTTMLQGGAVTGAKLDPAISISTSGTIASAITTTRDFKIYATSPSTFYVGMVAPALSASYTLTWPLNAGTTGQVLTTNGSGVLSWTTPSSAGITALTGDVTASGPGSAAATVASVGGSTAALVHSAELAANAATSANTPSAIVKRDGSGGFTAGAVTATSSVYKDSGSNTVSVQAPATVTTSYVLKYPAAAASSSGQVLSSDTSGNLSWTNPLTSSTAFVQGGNTFGAVADLGTNDAFDLRLRANGSTAMTVKSTGKVGVGTTNPAYLLDVNGTARFGNTGSHDTSHTVLSLDSNSGSNSGVEITGNRGSGGLQSTYFNFYNGSTDVAEINVWTGSTANRGAIAFNTTGSSAAERMRIDENGNVGIATSSPQARLHVVGSTRLEGTTTAYNGAALNFVDSGLDRSTTLVHVDDADFRISTSSGPITLMPGSSSNVGIGTTSPVTKLDVAGSLRVGDGGETCSATYAGGVRFNGGNIQFCDGTNWSTLGVAGAGITALTGDVTATGSGSVAATVATVGGYSAANVAAGATLANAATASNTPSTIVKRDGSGNFAASAVTQTSSIYKDSGSNTVTLQAPSSVSTSYVLKLPTAVAASAGQALTSDTSGNLSWTTISGTPTGTAGGDLSGTYPNPSVATVGTSTAALLHSAELAANAATASNTVSTIVKRDGTGGFMAGDVTTSTVKADTLKLNNAGSVVNVVNPIGSAYTFTLPGGTGSSGQVLSTDGTGVTSWIAAPTSSQWTTQAPGINYMGGYVGIGTTSPTSALTVVGTSGPLVDARATDSNAQLRVINTSSTAARYPALVVTNYDGGFGGSSGLYLDNSGGTSGTPAALGTGKSIGTVNFRAYDGAGTQNVATIGGVTDSAFASGNPSGSIVMSTNSGTGLAARMAILANGNVGIGTTNPSSKVTISGNDSNGVLTVNNAAVGAYVSGFNVLAPNLASGNATQFKLGKALAAGQAAEFNFKYGATSVMSLGMYGSPDIISYDTNANVGIGTVAPSNHLHVAGTATQDIIVETTNSAATSEAGVIYKNPSGVALTGLAGYAGRIMNSSNANDFIFNNRIGPIIFSADSAFTRSDLVVATSGKVGIGTTAPTAGLHLKAGAAAAGSAPLKLTAGTNLSTPEAGAIEYDGNNLYYTTAANTRQTLATVGGGGTSSTASQTFNSDNDNSGDGGFNFQRNGTNLFTISNAGDVAVTSSTASTNSGTGALTVAGGLGVGGAINAGGTILAPALTAYAGSATVYTPTSSSLMVPTAVNVQTNNNTTADGTMAEFTMLARNTATNPQRAYIGAVSVTGASAYTPAVVIGQQTGATAYAERMRIDENGKVGIGTTNPSSRLTVVGPNSAGFPVTISAAPGTGPGAYMNLALDNTSSGAYKSAVAFLNNGNAKFSFGVDYLGNGSNNFSLFDNVAGAMRWYIDPNGNVGIGTSSPTNNFEVRSPTNASLLLSNDNPTSNPTTSIRLQNYRGAQGGGDPAFISYAAMGSSTSPAPVIAGMKLFSLQGRGYTDGGYWDSQASAYVEGVATGTWGGGGYGPSDLRLGTSFVERVRIDATGKVGIGTTSPVATLNVNGAIVSNTQTNAVAVTNINFETGNVQVSNNSTNNAPFKVCGLKDGGQYTLILKAQPNGSVPTFTAYSDAACSTAITNFDSGGVTFLVSSNTVILTFVRAGNTVYAMYAAGFTN